MSLKSRVDQLERGGDTEWARYVVQRLEGETVEQCIAREGISHPVYVFPPAEPRAANGELAAPWIAGCVRWTGERIEPVEPGFDPRSCNPRYYDPDPDV